ncbi:hypothetical protein Q5752_003409 [Cryptotrichosporon argae]
MLGVGAVAAAPNDAGDRAPETITIASTGLDFFSYRRALFLAGLPLPEITSAPPPTYTLLPAPAARPAIPHAPGPTLVGRLETLLAADGGVESDDAWDMGVRDVVRSLNEGRKLSRGLRLGLIIKVLRASWIRDGTWPIDPQTSRALRPPDSPPPSPGGGSASLGASTASAGAGTGPPAEGSIATPSRPAMPGPYSSGASGPSVPSALSGG